MSRRKRAQATGGKFMLGAVLVVALAVGADMALKHFNLTWDELLRETPALQKVP